MSENFTGPMNPICCQFPGDCSLKKKGAKECDHCPFLRLELQISGQLDDMSDAVGNQCVV